MFYFSYILLKSHKFNYVFYKKKLIHLQTKFKYLWYFFINSIRKIMKNNYKKRRLEKHNAFIIICSNLYEFENIFSQILALSRTFYDFFLISFLFLIFFCLYYIFFFILLKNLFQFFLILNTITKNKIKTLRFFLHLFKMWA